MTRFHGPQHKTIRTNVTCASSVRHWSQKLFGRMRWVSNFIQTIGPPYWSLEACLALKMVRGKRSSGTWLWRKWSLKLTVPLASWRSSGSSTKIKTLVINFFVNLLSASAVHWWPQYFEGNSLTWLVSLAWALSPTHYRFCLFFHVDMQTGIRWHLVFVKMFYCIMFRRCSVLC